MNLDMASNWNIVDKIIFSIEHGIKTISDSLQESRSLEPDVEVMIAAETEHLRRENVNLKKREIPVYLIEEEGDLVCPKCRSRLPGPQDAVVNYCSNCGHRVIRHVLNKRE